MERIDQRTASSSPCLLDCPDESRRESIRENKLSMKNVARVDIGQAGEKIFTTD